MARDFWMDRGGRAGRGCVGAEMKHEMKDYTNTREHKARRFRLKFAAATVGGLIGLTAASLAAMSMWRGGW